MLTKKGIFYSQIGSILMVMLLFVIILYAITLVTEMSQIEAGTITSFLTGAVYICLFFPSREQKDKSMTFKEKSFSFILALITVFSVPVFLSFFEETQEALIKGLLTIVLLLAVVFLVAFIYCHKKDKKHFNYLIKVSWANVLVAILILVTFVTLSPVLLWALGLVLSIALMRYVFRALI